MQMTISMLTGALIGLGLFLVTRKRPAAAVWTALVLGAIGTVLFVGMLGSWIWPEAGMFHAAAVGVLSGIATALAVGCLVRGERRALNWIALVLASPPVLFLIVFGLAHLVGPGD